jgi:hypothetical protein
MPALLVSFAVASSRLDELAGRGINRHSGALIIAAYLVFAITVTASAIRPAAQFP